MVERNKNIQPFRHVLSYYRYKAEKVAINYFDVISMFNKLSRRVIVLPVVLIFSAWNC